MQEARTNKYVFFGRVRGCRRYSRICFVRGCAIPATHDITTYVIVSHGDWKNASENRSRGSRAKREKLFLIWQK
jgi:hypothetical protein